MGVLKRDLDEKIQIHLDGCHSHCGQCGVVLRLLRAAWKSSPDRCWPVHAASESITTKRGVHTHFGQPHDVVYTGDESTWIYYYTKWTMHGVTFVPFVGLLAGGGNYDNTVTAFHFDQDGLFQRVASDNSVNYVNMWEGLVRAPVKLLTEQQTDRVRKEMAHLGIPFDPAVARKVKDITSAHRIGQKPPQ